MGWITEARNNWLAHVARISARILEFWDSLKDQIESDIAEYRTLPDARNITTEWDSDDHGSPNCKVFIDGKLSALIAISVPRSELILQYENDLRDANLEVDLRRKEFLLDELPDLSRRILLPVLFFPLWLKEQVETSQQ